MIKSFATAGFCDRNLFFKINGVVVALFQMEWNNGTFRLYRGGMFFSCTRRCRSKMPLAWRIGGARVGDKKSALLDYEKCILLKAMRKHILFKIMYAEAYVWE